MVFNLPSMWIERRNNILHPPSLPALAITGVRQAGKSAFLLKNLQGHSYVTLDDPTECATAQEDPVLFLRQHPFPLVVDECQLAPNFFRALKAALDLWRTQGRGHECAVWLSGSNRALVERGLQEALAGRVSIRTLHPLSLQELEGAGIALSPSNLFLRGGWPELHAQPALSHAAYLNDYLRTAVEKDVALFEGVSKVERLSRLIRLLAGRTGQVLNVSEIARDCGISPPTASQWIDGLVRLGFVVKCEPFHSNLSKRLIKSPKIYFNETSLATRASGWSEIEPLLVSPQAGSLLENIVHQELIRHRDNAGFDWKLSFLRTREGEELDFVVEAGNGRRLGVEVKLGGGDPLRARLGVEAKKALGEDVPLVLVGLTTTTRQWRGNVWTVRLPDVGPFVEHLLV
jgi:predicted AAA+ superfamily ATPase